MRVFVDRDKCCGYANCVMVAPEVFALLEGENLAVAVQEHPGEELRPMVEEAVRDCPTEAVMLEED